MEVTSVDCLIYLNRIRKTKIQIEQLLKQNSQKMIKYYTNPSYRKHYSDLQKLNMLSQNLEVEPYDLSLYALRVQKQDLKKGSKSPGKASKQVKSSDNPQKYFQQLIADLQVYKSQTLTPVKIFKSLLLIHCCFLLVKTTPSDDNINEMNSYFKWVLQQTVKLIEKHSKKQNQKRGSSKGRNSLSKKAETTTSDLLGQKRSNRPKSSSFNATSRSNSTSKNPSEQIMSKQLCLLVNIIKPYILYLQKILSIYSHYQNLLHSIPSTLESLEQSTWMILNIFKLITPIAKNFNHIGRYFYKQYSTIVYLLIQFFSKQVYRLYPKINSQVKRKITEIQHRWFVLLEQHSEYQIFHNEQIQIEGVQNAMILVDQIVKINDSLYHIYLGKYFYQVIQKLKLPEPRWFEIHSKQCQFLLHYNTMKYKNGRRKSIRKSKQKRSSSIQQRNQKSNPFSDNKISSGRGKMNIQNNDLPKSQPIYHKIRIQKKNLIPKVKNSLKLVNQKDKRQKQDTITFRVKQLNKSLNRSKTIGEQSFLNQEPFQKQQDIETIRAKVRKYQIVQV